MAEPKADGLASIISAVASLVSALAWPTLVAVLLYGLYRHADDVASGLRRLTGDGGSAKFSFSGTGLSFELVQKSASASANAVIESVKRSESGPLNSAQASQVERNAQSAAFELASVSLDPRKRFKILWVDDHPENNIYLQYAFQTLGIVVVCIDSDNGLPEAFDVASTYDLVITDMGRDEMNGVRPGDKEAGLKTLARIKKEYDRTPAIIYAGYWANAHRDDNLGPEVLKITNRPQELFEIVTSLAKRKAARN